MNNFIFEWDDWLVIIICIGIFKMQLIQISLLLQKDIEEGEENESEVI